MRVWLPRGRSFKYATQGGRLEPRITDEGKSRLYHWQTANRRELPKDENAPSAEEFRLQVLGSTMPTWDDVGTWERRLEADCWQCTDDVKDFVQAAVRNAHTPLDKAQCADLLGPKAHSLRLGGRKTRIHSSSAKRVLSVRYGDCKDQAQLLVLLLREAGVETGLATLSTLGFGQLSATTPYPLGNHALVVVSVDGQDHWIDTTVNQGPWDFLPRDDRDRVAYIVNSKKVQVTRTPALSPSDNRLEQTTSISVSADGSTRNRRSSRYFGLAAMHQRDEWLEVPSGERRQSVVGELQNAHGRSRLIALTIDDQALGDFDRPVAACVDYVVTGHFHGELVREGNVFDRAIWNKLLAANVDYDRKVPLDLGSSFESIHRFLISIPPAFQVETLPEDKVVTSRWGAFCLKVRLLSEKPGQLEIEFHTRIASNAG